MSEALRSLTRHAHGFRVYGSFPQPKPSYYLLFLQPCDFAARCVGNAQQPPKRPLQSRTVSPTPEDKPMDPMSWSLGVSWRLVGSGDFSKLGGLLYDRL